MAQISTRELHRKLLHVVFCVAFATLFYLDVLDLASLIVILLAAVLICVAYRLTRHHKKPLFGFVFQLVERKENKDMPGRNFITIILAGLIASLFLPSLAIAAALLILAIGDPLAYIIGMQYGKTPMPWNKKKHLEGRIAGIIGATLVTSLLYPFSVALQVATLTLLIESFPWERINLDDNFVIPIVAALLFTLLV